MIHSRRFVMLSALGVIVSAAPPAASAQFRLASGLEPLERLLGRWTGNGTGIPGNSMVERSYSAVLGGKFIEVRNRSVYAPQAQNPDGESHEDVGYWSFDRARKVLVLRQFHLEGFVNQYAGVAADPLVMTSEAIENIGAGFRARETYRLGSDGRLEETFEIAAPGEAFELYSRNVMRRA